VCLLADPPSCVLQGAFTVPGTFSAAPISQLLPTTTPVLPFGSTHSTALPPLATPSAASTTWEPQPNLNALAPQHNGLSFFYGSTEWGKNEGLTESLFSKLGDCARRRIEQSNDEGIWRGGVIVDTPAVFTKKEQYKWITRAVREFESEPIQIA
jgi:polyribonucleotide 5'-hydroxyl-kinase